MSWLRFFSLLILVSLFQSCATVEKDVDPQPIATEVEVSLEKPAQSMPFDRVVLISIDGGEEVSLRELAAGRPVVVDFSASWCKPCGELTARFNKLKNSYFNDNVLFIMILSEGDQLDQEHPEPQFGIYTVLNMPSELSGKGVYPRVLIFDSKGELASETEGLFPSMLYYGVLADLVNQ